MKTSWHHVLIAMALSAGAMSLQAGEARPSVVKVEKTATGFELRRNGEPYFIKGAGGRRRLEALVAAGGNSIRTWHSRDMTTVLDQAHALGLTVTFGIWLGHERHGHDYSDARWVETQVARARRAVLAHKDHPALLMWGIGNEMEGNGSNVRVWKTVNSIARMIKELDPNHPTMTVIAGVWPNKVRQLETHCPDIDVVGINAYGNLVDVPAEAQRRGLSRPYVVTEFGPTGWWEVQKTSWGVAIEPTSTAKAQTYQQGYRTAVSGQPGVCLGCYAFLWGHKQEHTRTWFGLFLPEGQRTAAIDVLTREWTGRWPDNRCPEIVSVTVGGAEQAGAEAIFAAGTEVPCAVTARDANGDALTCRWELRSESTDKRSGGDPEEAPPAHPEAILSTQGSGMVLKTPAAPGAYRVFVYVLDGHGNAASANVPLLVR